MYKGAKTISRSWRPKIDTLKSEIRCATNPFDSDGYVFVTALKELRKEGLKIIRDRRMCRYYNADTIDKMWGYN